MESFTTRVFRAVARHFVSLSCLQRAPSGEERSLVFSGFLVAVAGQWFFVAAGHILEAVRDALASGYTFDRWRLDDQTAGNAFKGMAVPLAFDPDEWLVVENEELGLDYAALPLLEMYRLPLAAGGVQPLVEDAWGDHVTDRDHWLLVGIPRESVSFDGAKTITARVVMAPLSPCDEPEAAGQKVANQFYAKLHDDEDGVVADIDGMSGGPIFGLKNVDDKWKCQVIGVQSGWYQGNRVIAACPFSSFGFALRSLVEEAKRSLEGADET